MDIYKKLVKPGCDGSAAGPDRALERLRGLGGERDDCHTAYTRSMTPLFVKVQNVFFYIAPPFAVIFTLGIFWRRANGTAALTTIVSGFSFTLVLDVWLFPHVSFLTPYNTYLHRALLAWIFCM